ncbi:MAG TPA: metal-sensing transcriptional repressor [Candidatus Bathyarchaeia archaeon]|nr:metal-sensing transcriptional repressor [Candidatus Bathyarchaeia archaeon]
MKAKKPIEDKNEAIRRRINIIKGQLDGLMKMVEKEEYCVDLLSQSLAIQNSLKSLDGLILERHLRTHVADQFKNQKERAVKELLKVFKQSSKNR